MLTVQDASSFYVVYLEYVYLAYAYQAFLHLEAIITAELCLNTIPSALFSIYKCNSLTFVLSSRTENMISPLNVFRTQQHTVNAKNSQLVHIIERGCLSMCIIYAICIVLQRIWIIHLHHPTTVIRFGGKDVRYSTNIPFYPEFENKVLGNLQVLSHVFI